jgi:mono/diheme cytochrome c family protein
MSLSRYSTLSIVGFALLASACADDMGVQKPMHVDAIDQGQSEERGEEKELAGDVDAGSEEEADAASQAEADAGSAQEADAGEEEEEEDKGAGLPCAIEKLLQTRCQGCHGAMAKNGVPLMTLEHLMAPAKVDANVPVFERVLARVMSAERPMPPMGKGMPVSEEELALLQAWIDDGTPAERCEP